MDAKPVSGARAARRGRGRGWRTPSVRAGRSGRGVRTARLAAAVTAAVTAGTSLAACSSGTQHAAGTAGTDVATVARTGVRDGGTLRWATDTLPRTLNAYQADADAGTQTVAGAVLPSMFRLDAHGSPRLDTDFVTSAKVTAQEPKQVVTYTLNPKAKWSDGRAIGAADFTAQWKALGGKNTAYWTSRNAGYDRIAGIRQGARPTEVEVTFATPYADWESLFSPLYPKAVTADPDVFNDARTTLPAAAGPFALKAVDTKAGTVTLVRNPSWWGPRAKLDALVLTAAPRGERVADLAAGRLDLAEIEPDAMTAARHTRGVGVRKAPGAAYAQLAINGSSGPLADERVRHAVARAIDRKAIAKAVLAPLGLPPTALGNHLVLPSQVGYSDHSSALGTGGLAQARALLADAGWQRSTARQGEKAAAGPGRTAVSGAVTVVEPSNAALKNGKELSLRFVLPAHSPTLDDVGNRIARMLSGIGVRTELHRVDGTSFFQDHVASGDFDLALYSWPGTPFPATDDAPIFAKPVPAPDGSLSVAQNYTRVGTDQIDQLLSRAGTELDPGQERSLTAQADARIWAAAASIPLYQRPEVVALHTGVVNAGAFGFQTPAYENIGFRK